jgi:hypothetical protein
VPDVTASGGLVPFSDLPQITRVAPDLLTRLTGLQPGDFITLRTFQSLIDVIFMGRPGPIPEQLILRKSMARKISKRIADYNKVIRQIGRSNDFLVVDVNRFLDNIVKNGFDVPGVAISEVCLVLMECIFRLRQMLFSQTFSLTLSINSITATSH